MSDYWRDKMGRYTRQLRRLDNVLPFNEDHKKRLDIQKRHVLLNLMKAREMITEDE